MAISTNQKVAIYIRVSTHWQADKDSLKVQRRELIAYATMVLGIQEYEVFEDPGYSAKNTARPAYQSMMSRLRTGEYSHLLVWKIDRISRNLLDFASMYSELKDIGVAFVSKNEQFDTSSAVGEAMLKIILVFAELERNMTSERVTAVMLSRATNGQWNGGRVPYGYSWDKETETLSPSEPEATIIKRIYSMYTNRMSILQITRQLNSENIPTRSGGLWNAVGVNKILRNKFYTGSYTYNVHARGNGTAKKPESEWVEVEQHHTAIITQSAYDSVQRRLTANRRSGNAIPRSKSAQNVHVFAGLLTCGKCGKNMSATSDRARANGFRPSIYACVTRRKEKTCDNKYMSDIVLGDFVFNYIANIIRAQRTYSARTTDEVLTSKLLRGSAMSSTELTAETLEAVRASFCLGVSGVEFSAKERDVANSNETEALLAQKNRLTRALSRLKSLYLYGENPMSESEYTVERKRLSDELEAVDNKLSDTQPAGGLPEDEFIEKASYFLVIQSLVNDRYVDYQRLASSVDKDVLKRFVNMTIRDIVVSDGFVQSITFQSGSTHTFRKKETTR